MFGALVVLAMVVVSLYLAWRVLKLVWSLLAWPFRRGRAKAQPQRQPVIQAWGIRQGPRLHKTRPPPMMPAATRFRGRPRPSRPAPLGSPGLNVGTGLAIGMAASSFDDDDSMFSHSSRGDLFGDMESSSPSQGGLSDDTDSGSPSSTHGFDINPATGLPMMDGPGGVDVAGNAYGFSSHDHDWATSDTSIHDHHQDHDWSSSDSSIHHHDNW